MKEVLKYLEKNAWIFYAIAIILVIPALFINLGLAPYSSDEPIRGLVSLEMILSGDYLTPSLGGVNYYNKPPLYNWILVFFFKLFGRYDEWIIRIPATIALILFSTSIFLFLRKKFGKEHALISAFFIITCGDILFWDSLLGLIDITYSLVSFLSLIVIYHYFKKEKFLLLFTISYFLAACGFMMKALPSIAFQGISLLVYFIYKREFKKLFSFQHIIGILLFLLLVGSYFYIYSRNNDVNTYLEVLLNQSTQRTVVTHGWFKTILHFVQFPFEWIYHFAPWTILIICLIRRDFKRIWKSSDLVQFSTLIFIFNMLIYWTSPEFHARYILMLIPFAYMVLIYFYLKDKEIGSVRLRILENSLLVFITLAAVSFLIYIFHNDTRGMNNVVGVNVTFFVISTLLIYLFIKIKRIRLIIVVIVFLLMRISFNLYLHPIRVYTHDDQIYKNEALEIAALTKDEPVFIFESTPVHEMTLLYITREKMEIVRRKYHDLLYETFYITDDKGLEGKDYTNLYDFKIKWFPDQRLHIVKFHETSKKNGYL